jgi:hypothetical protein
MKAKANHDLILAQLEDLELMYKKQGPDPTLNTTLK